jgi:hypothetical protein
VSAVRPKQACHASGSVETARGGQHIDVANSLSGTEVALFVRQFLKYRSAAADLARIERVTQSIADQVE